MVGNNQTSTSGCLGFQVKILLIAARKTLGSNAGLGSFINGNPSSKGGGFTCFVEIFLPRSAGEMIQFDLRIFF